MGFTLNDLCAVVANEGAPYAKQLSEILIRHARALGKDISKEQADKTFTMLSFLTWAYANGVWSNLENTDLRRSLMATSLMSIAIKTSYELSQDRSKEAVAALATRLDEELKRFIRLYNEEMKQYISQGFQANPNTARVIVYEWIQKVLALNDEEMSLIVPQLGDSHPEKIEEIALKVNKSAKERKRGFLSRLFGGS